MEHVDVPMREPEYWDLLDRQVDQETAEYDPNGGNDKACANCQWFVPPGFCLVVRNWPDAILPTGLSTLWREKEKPFEPKPIQVEIVGEAEISDKVGKTEGGIEFQDSDYAVVPDADKPSTWKLRLAQDSSGNFTVAQVARAITAMQPSGFRGNRVQLTGDQKKQAVSRIGTAIGKTGGDDDQKANLRERLDKVKETKIMVSVPSRLKDAAMSKITAVMNALSKGDETPPLTGFKFFATKDGAQRWVAWVSNNYRDRDTPPEIIEEKAHKDFVAYLDDGGIYPEAWLWHVKGSRWGKADWVDYADGMLIMSGTVDEGKDAVAKALAANAADLGVSHGFQLRYSDQDKGIIGWYRTFEISPLPADKAANTWTALDLVAKEAQEVGINDDKREFLVQMMGEGAVQEIEGQHKVAADAPASAGAESKEVDGGGSGDGDPEPVPAVQDKVVDAVVASISAQVEEAVTKALDVKGLRDLIAEVNTALTGVKTRIDALEQTDDAKVAALLAPKTGAVRGARASQDDKTVLLDDDALAKKAAEPIHPAFAESITG